MQLQDRFGNDTIVRARPEPTFVIDSTDSASIVFDDNLLSAPGFRNPLNLGDPWAASGIRERGFLR